MAAGDPAPVESLAPVVSRVRQVVRDGPPGIQPTLADVARKLGVSPRTLRRRLAEVNTTYRQQLDDVLAARALDLLAEGIRSEEIAHSLGFSDASAFRRAFKRWTGRSPASHPSLDAERDHAALGARLRPALRHRRSGLRTASTGSS
ncbi:MAG TPA: helix-turn-helix transcriptional regulator [Myxococcota bacterium]|nr:helix-turn-helix transcriptional regulator [Myxococcota bacterium]